VRKGREEVAGAGKAGTNSNDKNSKKIFHTKAQGRLRRRTGEQANRRRCARTGERKTKEHRDYYPQMIADGRRLKKRKYFSPQGQKNTKKKR